jgi:tetratricopeptide (TPR) repeat protein
MHVRSGEALECCTALHGLSVNSEIAQVIRSSVFGLLLLLAPPRSPCDVASSIRNGDTAFARMEYPEAMREYKQGLESTAGASLLWRIARLYVLMSEVAVEPETSTLLDSALVYARASIRADSTDAGGYTWLAGALGYRALTADMPDRLLLSVQLLAALDSALLLQPSNDVALSITGSFYRALGNVGWIQRQLGELLFGDIPDGGYKEAEDALLRAIAIAPDVMRHRYELAVLYLDMERDEDAKTELLRASTLPIRIASDRPRLLKIAELLQERFAISVAVTGAGSGEGGAR